MSKVHSAGPVAVVGRLPPSVHLNRLSLLYNVVFTIKIATTPFFAYLTEPFPWALPAAVHPAWNATTSTEYSTMTAAYLQSIYNNATMPASSVCYRHGATNSNVLRLVRPLPPSTDTCVEYLVHMPGAGLYGAGMRRFVCTFLAASASQRRGMPWHHCLHAVMAGLPLGEVCVWFESTPHPRDVVVYHAMIIWENVGWCWGKLLFRCLLTTYILSVLWRRYYKHYAGLVHNLRTVGVHDDAPFAAYEVIVGDPTYQILRDPVVSIVMVLDIWLGMAYVAIATERVSQYEDWWQFLLGCMYTSRYVWNGYLMMWILSRVAKRCCWERWFSPVDPSFLGVMAYFYGGPILLLVGNTSLMVPIHALWDVAAPAQDRDYYMEVMPGCAFWSIVMASVPVTASTSVTLGRRVRRLWGGAQPHDDLLSGRHFCPRQYNDVKSRFVLKIAMRRVAYEVPLEGGSLYTLIQRRPSFRRMPLFSHRGADCCVLAYHRDKTVVRQMRLTLRDCIDLLQLRHIDAAVPVCVSMTPSTYCTLSSATCALCRASTGRSGMLRLHAGANYSPWLLCLNDGPMSECIRMGATRQCSHR
ncbi:hypothetical protein H310_13890 [Aphanomyces invadans]|uniref:Uncharacterized protein n=1 Tax=Aphanomyces invadans TaxID=157072 RepID=A0A024TCB0_9STRA|nr:hypothetical protein H310_13890 [Aphanomyces invadans]ETV91644.1 hypothetical protein H310_13890 [Aphanomyces invadans]|eukprot:XP_008879763.1 hypothetical protein H310_13890 [Aphanomyces invadans]